MATHASSSRPRFARYRPSEREIQGRHFWAVPEGGICLSVFLVVSPAGDKERVLLGRPDPRAAWESMATLEAAHVAAIGDRWILPASHLLEWESPNEAAHRVAFQQLGLSKPRLCGPEVFSETYPSVVDPESGLHWDVDFVYRLELPEGEIAHPPAWRDLVFHPTQSLTRAQIARGHGDILVLCGHPLKDQNAPPPNP